MTCHRFGFLFDLRRRTTRFVTRSEKESGDKSPHSINQQAASSPCHARKASSFKVNVERAPDRLVLVVFEQKVTE
jgi:hypothetical protein